MLSANVVASEPLCVPFQELEDVLPDRTAGSAPPSLSRGIASGIYIVGRPPLWTDS